MVPYYGDFAEDDTVLIPFNTFSSDDPSASVTITNLADADIMVHKDGGTTQIVTDGATVAINFDSITGNHLITIDTSVHADYATGSEYAVRIEGTTVDGATINAWVGAFSIERAGGVLALIKAGNLSANVVQISGDAIAADNAESFFDGTGYAGTGNVIPTVTTLTNNSDKTGYALSAAGVDAILDETLTAHVTADSLGVAVKDILADTNELQADDYPTALAAIEADTQDLQARIGAAGAGLTAVPWNVAWDAEVQSECTDALNAYDPPTQTELLAAHSTTDGLITTVDGVVDAILLDTAEIGAAGVGLTAINLPDQTMNITGNITGNLSGSVGSVTGAVGSVTGAVGSVTSQVSANMTGISGSSTAADNLEASALGVVPGACEGTPSTTVIQTNLAETTDDHYIGRVVVFTSGGAAGQATGITDYTGATGTLTVTALTTAPAATDTFVIV